MASEDPYFAALKLFLVFGPLLGFAALELILLLRDKRRAGGARSAAVPARSAVVVRSRGGPRARG